MGFLKKLKAAYSSGVLVSEVENQYLDLQKSSPSSEAFERLVTIWKAEMTKRGKPLLAANGDFTVHYWILVTNNAKDACKLLAHQISAYTDDAFKDTIEFREMEQALYPIMKAYQDGEHDMLNVMFEKRSPISYARFLAKHGRGPFTPPPERR